MIKAIFGYRIENGRPIINQREAKILQKLAEEYIGGTSLKTAAERLTAERAEYAPGKSDWNKNRVQRRLTDRTYLGDENYPPIIDRETFAQIQTVMQSRNTQTGCNRQEVFSSSVVPLLCGKCGHPTVRRYDVRWGEKTKHICTNPDCKAIYAVSDCDMRRMVGALLANTEQPQENPSEELLMAIRRLDNGIGHDLQSLDINAENLKNKILECAALKYAAIQSHSKESMDFSNESPCSRTFIREVKRRVSAVLLDGKGAVRLRLTDGRIIGKEGSEHDADNSHNTPKESSCDPADRIGG